MRNRIAEIRRQRGLSQEQLADRAGIDVSYLSRLETGKRRINTDMLERIAIQLSVSVPDLLSPTPIGGSETPLQDIIVTASVQAGVWMGNRQWPEDERYRIAIPIIERAEMAFGLEIRGDSMNRVFPAGTVIICVPILDFWRNLQSGDYVVCERVAADDSCEATAKQLVFENSHLWLWPRSTRPEFQAPISIPWPPVDESEGKIKEIRIVAVIIGAYSKLA